MAFVMNVFVAFFGTTLLCFTNGRNNPVSTSTLVNFDDPFVKSHLEALVRIGQSCMLKTNASPREAYAYFTNAPSVTRNEKCFAFCMLEASGVVKRGKINRDTLIHLSSVINGKESKVVEILEVVSKSCIGRVNGISDKCELGAKYNDCLNTNMADFGFPVDIAQDIVQKMLQILPKLPDTRRAYSLTH